MQAGGHIDSQRGRQLYKPGMHGDRDAAMPGGRLLKLGTQADRQTHSEAGTACLYYKCIRVRNMLKPYQHK